MKPVLIGCECSAIVRDEFRARGLDAWSCDIKPCEGDPQWHIRGDVMDAITSRRWDFIGLHPDCTCLAVSGNRWYGRGQPRHNERVTTLAWTAHLWKLAVTRSRFAYLENPVGVINDIVGMPKPQYIQPWQFGHGETKKTGLWLNGLPPLAPTNIVDGREQKVWRMGPSKTRKADRSRTHQGVAAAMAGQWGNLI